ncbi:MAG: hypothetical protein DDT33_01341 [Firmicutes bacterium]|nr:hypothetical protein [Bacillota bacterium]
MLNKKMYRKLLCYYMVRSEEGSSLEEVRKQAELFKRSVLTKGEREAVLEMWDTLKRWKEFREELKGEK